MESDRGEGSEVTGSLAIEAGRRWSIWIDIEGFSRLWEKGPALAGLNALMHGIHAIGSRAYPDDGDRLFAHQFGDGFVIVGDFHEESLDRCVAVAVALMRHVVTSGCLARAAIAEGEFADYAGCRPKHIQQAMVDIGSDDVVPLGSGIMTLLPVMGTALINANKLDSGNRVKGAVLTIAADDAERVSPTFPRRVSELDSNVVMIDWVRACSPFLGEIVARSEIGGLSPTDIEDAVARYALQEPTPPPAWLHGTSEYARLSVPLPGAKP